LLLAYLDLWQGGKTIAGFSNPRGPVYSPSCECLKKEVGYEKIPQLLREMFASHYDFSAKHCQIKKFPYAMFASFLRWLPDFITAFGEDHSIINRFKINLKRHEIS
jgi:hypothetical protein